MIGPRALAPEWAAFNLKWGSPYGYHAFSRTALFKAAVHGRSLSWQARAIGPFGFQPGNNATRVFEYPWAYFAVPIRPGMTAIDLGGSLGGFQFVLSRAGANVVNVDPAINPGTWPVDGKTIAKLNTVFRTHVELRNTFLADAAIGTNSVDVLYSISTLEHIPQDQLPALAKELARILKPGGFAVLTVDLFYDLAPFTHRESNVHGRNIDVRLFVEDTGLELHKGDRKELCGYREFHPPTILSRATEFVQGHIALNTAQALVLRKRDRTAPSISQANY